MDTAKRPASPDLLHLVHSSLTDDKAIEPVTVDLIGKTSIADAMVIATGSSQRHLATMAQHLLERLKAAGLKGLSSEGSGQSDWILIDAGVTGDHRPYLVMEYVSGLPIDQYCDLHRLTIRHRVALLRTVGYTWRQEQLASQGGVGFDEMRASADFRHMHV